LNTTAHETKIIEPSSAGVSKNSSELNETKQHKDGEPSEEQLRA
jgi:hypothetical protein